VAQGDVEQEADVLLVVHDEQTRDSHMDSLATQPEGFL
jgi:hypothetical protein